MAQVRLVPVPDDANDKTRLILGILNKLIEGGVAVYTGDNPETGKAMYSLESEIPE